MSNEIILYQTEDGQARIQLRAADGTVWLSQNEIAELFATTTPNVNIHIKNILQDGEADAVSVIKESLITAADGKNCRTKLYNLDMILAVGYRVKSPRGTQSRQWATVRLKEYLVKGFVLDDERLKAPGRRDYFDELLARIRAIRASELRFYQKVRDLFALSTDYRDDEQAAHIFFAEVQNKLLYAVTRKTAAEIVVTRADPDAPQHGSHFVERQPCPQGRRQYCQELSHGGRSGHTLNRLVSLFLDQAEMRVKERKQLTLDYWRQNVGQLLAFSERPILEHAGSISAEAMKAIAHERYAKFDASRRPASRRR